MKCPKCGQEDFFRIEGWELTSYIAHLNNVGVESSTVLDTLQSGIEPDSYAVCDKCGHEDEISAFGPNYPFPILPRPRIEKEPEKGVKAADLVRTIDDLLRCTDLNLDELDPSSMTAIENAKRLTDTFKGVSKGGAT